jgi:hypothetical protein
MNTSTSTPPVPPAHTPEPESHQITIVSHSMLFYWWPVWAVGLILAGLTRFDNHFMVSVPAQSEVVYDADVQTRPANDGAAKKWEDREVIILPKSTHKNVRHLPKKDEANPDSEPKPLFLHIANRSSYGVIFTIVLILVIIITNVPLRGMWSVLIITLIILFSIIFELADWWTPILKALSLLDIRINAGGYLFISLILLVIWAITLVFFDRQIYVVFTPGQFRVCTEIGGAVKVYGTVGMKLEKQRSNLFLHWIIGLGSGDLIIRPANAEQIDLPNVLFIGQKVNRITSMLAEQKVVETR